MFMFFEDLAGRDNWEQAKVDEIADFHADVGMVLQVLGKGREWEGKGTFKIN
jgi:hypothetical protein